MTKPTAPKNSAELNTLAQRIHAANEKWWQDVNTHKPIQRNRFELLSLAISEVSECLEGERKDLMDDKLPKRKMAEVEMADAYIRLLDFSVGFGLSLLREQKRDGIAQNKGEALFHLMRLITYVGGEKNPEFWVGICLIYIEQYCEKWGYDLWGAIDEKLDFNRTRIDHQHEQRKLSNGKKF